MALKADIKRALCAALIFLLCWSAVLPAAAAVIYPGGVTREMAAAAVGRADALVKDGVPALTGKSLRETVDTALCSDETLSSLLLGVYTSVSDQGDARLLAYLGSIRDQILNSEELATDLVKLLYSLSPEAVLTRFRITAEDINPPQPEYDGEWHDIPTVLDRICAGRGWLLSGGRPDTARAAAIVLDEFRAGLIGRFSLQKPGDRARDEAPLPVLQSQLEDRPDLKRRPDRRTPGR